MNENLSDWVWVSSTLQTLSLRLGLSGIAFVPRDVEWCEATCPSPQGVASSSSSGTLSGVRPQSFILRDVAGCEAPSYLQLRLQNLARHRARSPFPTPVQFLSVHLHISLTLLLFAYRSSLASRASETVSFAIATSRPKASAPMGSTAQASRPHPPSWAISTPGASEVWGLLSLYLLSRYCVSS